MMKRGGDHGTDAVRNDMARDPGPNPFFTLVDTLCTPRVLREVKGRPRPEGGIVRIALVSMPDVDYSPKEIVWRGKLPRGVDAEDVRRTLGAVRNADAKKMLETFKEALKVALEECAANVVCFSELGLPSRNAVPLVEAQRIASRMSRRHNALVIAGTAHDSRTMFNTGYLFHPADKPATWAFHKSASALKMQERIMAPAHRRVLIIDTFGLRIAVMICLDVVDYTTLASVMRAGDQVDMVLVPCYTKRFEKMQDVASVASEALPGVVVLVNACLPHVGWRYIAQCGETLDLPALPVAVPGGAEVALLSLKIDELHEKRTQAKTDPDPYLDWMFGSRYRPRAHEHPQRI